MILDGWSEEEARQIAACFDAAQPCGVCPPCRLAATSPTERTDVAPAGSYQCGEAVWVHKDDRWRPGKVQGSGTHAVLVHYWVGQGSSVDTVTAEFVMRREPE